MPGASLSYIPYPSAFVPTSIPGCVLWMDAADPLGTGVAPTNGATVSSWIDKSGNGYNSPANTTGATFNTNVQNGYGALTFTSGQYYITPTLVLSSTNTPTVFLVCIQTGGGGNSEIVVCGIGRALYLQLDLFQKNGTLRLDMYGNGSESGSIPISSPTFITLIGYGSPTYTATLWGNGTSNVTITGSSANPVSTSAQYLIGACSGFVGTIYEVLFYNTAFTTTQQQQVEGYLAWKWGLQANLPGGHPYASAAPTTPNSLGISRPAISLALAPTGVKSMSTAPYTTTFAPTSIAGCQLWLDGADATTITGTSPVTQWMDKSGNSRTMTSVVGSGVLTYANNGIYCSNAYMFVTSPVNLINFSLFIVAKASPSSANCSLFVGRPNTSASYSSTDGFGFYLDTTYTARLFINGNNLTNTAIYTNQNLYSYTVTSAGSISSWVNGNVGNSFGISARSTTAQGFALGAEWGGSSYGTGGLNGVPTNGYVYEVIVYNTALTTAQCQQVEGYLAWKWGVQSSLPNTHLQYAAAPVGANLRPAISAALVPAGVRGVTAKLNLKNYTQTFTYTGADQTFVVPSTTTSLTVYMWGAGGGGGYTGTGTLYGGAGAYLQGVLPVTSGQTLKIIVGGGGGYQPNVVGTTPLSYGGGGFGSPAGGAGGGRSAIRVSGASDDSVTVGAGGGAAYWSYNNSYGGNGDSVTGTGGNGGTSGSYYGGLGGSQTAGGAVGHGDGGDGITAGSKYTGGNPSTQTGGGGGGGYYGGGPGGWWNYGSGGGGGSSLTSNLTSIVAYNSSNIYSAPYTTSPYYQSGVAAGGSNGLSGGNGLVVITYSA
jgi:Glycine rich protein